MKIEVHIPAWSHAQRQMVQEEQNNRDLERLASGDVSIFERTQYLEERARELRIRYFGNPDVRITPMILATKPGKMSSPLENYLDAVSAWQAEGKFLDMDISAQAIRQLQAIKSK